MRRRKAHGTRYAYGLEGGLASNCGGRGMCNLRRGRPRNNGTAVFRILSVLTNFAGLRGAKFRNESAPAGALSLRTPSVAHRLLAGMHRGGR